MRTVPAPTTFAVATRTGPLSGVRVTVTEPTGAPDTKPFAAIETAAPTAALFGLTDSRLMFCAYKGTSPVANKNRAGKPSARKARAALCVNGFVVGKVIAAQAETVQTLKEYCRIIPFLTTACKEFPKVVSHSPHVFLYCDPCIHPQLGVVLEKNRSHR